MRSRWPIVKVPIDHGTRFADSAPTNLTALVNHGLASVAVFIALMFVRLLVINTQNRTLSVLLPIDLSTSAPIKHSTETSFAASTVAVFSLPPETLGIQRISTDHFHREFDAFGSLNCCWVLLLSRLTYVAARKDGAVSMGIAAGNSRLGYVPYVPSR